MPIPPMSTGHRPFDGDSNIDNEPFYGCRGVIAPHLVDLRLQDIERLRIERVIH